MPHEKSSSRQVAFDDMAGERGTSDWFDGPSTSKVYRDPTVAQVPEYYQMLSCNKIFFSVL